VSSEEHRDKSFTLNIPRFFFPKKAKKIWLRLVRTLPDTRLERIAKLVEYGRNLISLVGEPLTEGFKQRIAEEAIRRFQVSEETAKSYAAAVYLILKSEV
jgi:hypothetical protein